VHEEGFRVEIVKDAEEGEEERGGRGGGGGKKRRGMKTGHPLFYWPDGQPFPNVPPALRLPTDPVRALEAENGRAGILVDSETAALHWNGEPFDVGWAIHTLWRA
jgi:hypothetical protein